MLGPGRVRQSDPYGNVTPWDSAREAGPGDHPGQSAGIRRSSWFQDFTTIFPKRAQEWKQF